MRTITRTDLIRRLASLPALDFRTSHRILLIDEDRREAACEADPGIERWLRTQIPRGWVLDEEPVKGGDLVLRPWVAGP